MKSLDEVISRLRRAESSLKRACTDFARVAEKAAANPPTPGSICEEYRRATRPVFSSFDGVEIGANVRKAVAEAMAAYEREPLPRRVVQTGAPHAGGKVAGRSPSDHLSALFRGPEVAVDPARLPSFTRYRNRETGDVVTLTEAEARRFFDNRDPAQYEALPKRLTDAERLLLEAEALIGAAASTALAEGEGVDWVAERRNLLTLYGKLPRVTHELRARAKAEG